MLHRGSVPSRRWVCWLVSVIIIGLVLPTTAVGLAQDAPLALEEAIERAIKDDSDRRAHDGIHVVPAVERTGWSFGTAVLQGTERGDGPPDVVFYIAERDGAGWRAAVEPTAAYDRMLRQAPKGMIPNVFLPSGDGVRGQAGDDPTLPRLSMPWSSGKAILASGPQGENVANPAARPWSSINFEDDAGIPILAAAPGFATSPCAVGDDHGALVVIQHADGWRTIYYHLTGQQATNFPRQVKRWHAIGFLGGRGGAGGCEGEIYPPQLHFALHRVVGNTEVGVDLDGVFIGGWEVIEGSTPEQGCLRKRMYDGRTGRSRLETVCRNGEFFTDGAIGKGARITRIKPNTVVAGQQVELTMQNLPPNRRLAVVYYWRMNGRSFDKEVARFQTGNGEKGTYFKFRQPHWVDARSATLCIEGTFYDVDEIVCDKVRVKP